MSDTPLAVDVIIPTHNRHARLESTLRSLAAQTFREFAVIVVDDVSEAPVPATGVLGGDRKRGG